MKDIFIICILFSFFQFAGANITTAQVIKRYPIMDSLIYLDTIPTCDNPFDETLSETNLYWRIAQNKIDIIPELIEKLEDTATTNASVAYAGGKYSVADASVTLIMQLIKDVPVYKLMGINLTEGDCGSCVYWGMVNSGGEFRKPFRIRMRDWFVMNKHKLKWVEETEGLEKCGYKNFLNGFYIF